MPKSDYTSSSIVGGALKLKGSSSTTDSGIKKHKKKKSKSTPDPKATDPKPTDTAAAADGSKDAEQSLQRALADEDPDHDGGEDETQSDAQRIKARIDRDAGKTETQRRHGERRRKRLYERLEREGVKTHKERVEELNKYLSGLSEHHDMPRIGPG